MYSNDISSQIDKIKSSESDLFFYDLVCFELPGKNCEVNHRVQYQKLFDFWYRVWQQTFTEINLSFSQFSDEFCRHEYAIALFHKEEVIACVLVDQFDLQNKVHLKHHYFANYPEEVIQNLSNRALGKPIMTVGYLTLDKKYRKFDGLTDVVLGLAVKKFLESENHILISYTRNTRRTNDLTFRLGAKIILADVMVRGEPSDFVYFDKSSDKKFMEHSKYHIIMDIWESKFQKGPDKLNSTLKMNQ
jgi:hypothetical protein